MDNLKSMFNPMHPGEFIQSVYLEPYGLSGRELAKKLRLSPSTVSRMLSKSSRVTPEMAVRLSEVLGRYAESWLTMQNNFDLWQARNMKRRPKLVPLELASA